MQTNELLKLTLDVYEEECQYLKEVTINGKEAWGKFSVPTTVYAVKGRKYHLNAVEVLIVYEQIMYVTLANIFVNGLEKLRQIPLDVFFPTIVDEKILIANSNVRCSKQVDHNEFTGIFKITRIINKKEGYWVNTLLNINSGAQVAEVKLYVDLKNQEF